MGTYRTPDGVEHPIVYIHDTPYYYPTPDKCAKCQHSKDDHHSPTKKDDTGCELCGCRYFEARIERTGSDYLYHRMSAYSALIGIGYTLQALQGQPSTRSIGETVFAKWKSDYMSGEYADDPALNRGYTSSVAEAEDKYY